MLADLLTTSSFPSDLRVVDCAVAVARVEAALGARFAPGPLRRKRRTLSGASVSGRWLRIEVRPDDRVAAQGWGGIEAAAGLEGVAKPRWYRSVSWHDRHHRVWWRADETELVGDCAVSTGGLLCTDPALPDQWWASLHASLSVLADQPAPRPAKLAHSVAIQALICEVVDRATTAVSVPPVDSAVDRWVTAHADLTWANLTGPRCWLLDWEDWGTAPFGFDQAVLLMGSLAVPSVAARVREVFAAQLDSRGGLISFLAVAADLLSSPDRAGDLLEPLRGEATRAATRLHESLNT